MILADTSVWIDHFRRGNAQLATALADGEIVMHPFIVGELACGNLRKRDEVLDYLQELPASRVATHDEALAMIAGRRLMGRGIGYVDVHLLAAAALTPGTTLWSLDRRLATAARDLSPA